MCLSLRKALTCRRTLWGEIRSARASRTAGSIGHQLKAPEKTGASYLSDDREAGRKLAELCLQIEALLGRVLHEAFLLDDVEDGECSGTGDRVILEREAVAEPAQRARQPQLTPDQVKEVEDRLADPKPTFITLAEARARLSRLGA